MNGYKTSDFIHVIMYQFVPSFQMTKIISNKEKKKLFSMKTTKNDDRDFKESNYCWKMECWKLWYLPLLLKKNDDDDTFYRLETMKNKKKKVRKKTNIGFKQSYYQNSFCDYYNNPQFLKLQCFFFVFSLLNFIICTFFLILQYIPLGIWKRSSPIFFPI